ncbi:leucine-rich repeat-containing protein 27 [Protopterus annectens]|uniref:leucine-rich repeat-containing protein 27 n=1 Tax=Protopterus annectens TaxID=7888 RepID=UPI001CF989C4|nr:leucine-rich repeat-containing protein 27 [Protopterus annectens]XP_043912751.1 leucine-rich repeat-containing protein 27 [Protopterus annectens]
MDEEGTSKKLTCSVAIQDSDDPYSSKEIKKAIQEVSANSSKTLDLSRRKIVCLTDDISQVSNIEHLYLEGNALTQLPENVFCHLPNLTWLDLRNNQLRSLPSSIGSHRYLKTLLLEGNPIKKLPVELGCLTTLKALNLRYCPLEFPPQDIVHRGLKAIQIFLRSAAKDVSCPQSPFKDVPVVERLKLGDSVKSSLNLSEEWGSEEEKEEFQRLRQQIIQEDEKEFFLSQSTVYDALSLPEKLKQIHDKQDEACRRQKPPGNLRVKRASLYGSFPDVSSYDLQILTKRKEDRQLAALKELKEKQVLIEQRRKDKDMLMEWRRKTKLAQEKNEIEHKFQGLELAGRDQVIRSAPYATDPNHYQMVNSHERIKQNVSEQHEHIRRPLTRKSVKETEDARNDLDKELEQKIRQHIQAMQERRIKPKGTVQEELEMAKKELNFLEKLRAEVALRKLEQDLPVEYQFTAFTGIPSTQRSTTALPRNIFSSNKF